MRFITSPDRCEYLPDRTRQLEYEIVSEITPDEYLERLHQGWRRFGHSLFRPACESCRACQPLRVPVGTFTPTASQRRAWKRNADVTLRAGAPVLTPAHQDLFARYHRFQHDTKGWSWEESDSPASMLTNPFPTEEWQYWVGDRLIGVGYVDPLRDGLSAIYFYYDPAERQRSLGTFNVLAILAVARQRGLPFVHLGYYVEGCGSLEYKARFKPNEVLDIDRGWRTLMAGA